MQGPGSSIGALPENLIFDTGSSSTDGGIDSEISWNSMPVSAQNHLPEYILSSRESHTQNRQHLRDEPQNAEWCLGETSSSAFCLRGNLNLEERPYDPYHIRSSNNVEVNANGNQLTNRSPFLLQNNHSSNAIPQDLNMSLGFEDEDDGDCRVIERPIAIGPTYQPTRSSGGPAGSYIGNAMDEGEDSRRTSCKRKALEFHAGPSSSGVGSSSRFQNAERSQRLNLPTNQIVPNNVSIMPTAAENNAVVNNGSANPRLRLGVGQAVSSSPFSLTPSGNAEISRRNFRLRINGLHPQEPAIPENPFSTNEADVGSSRSVIRNHLLDLNPPPALENGSNLLDVLPPVRRNHQSRWSGASSARSSRSSPPIAIPEDFAQRTNMFVPASETGDSPQNATIWNLSGAGSSNIGGNVGSTSRVGPSRGANSSAPSWSYRSSPQYHRRLSEIVRRSLLSSASNEAGDRSINNHVGRSGSSQEVPIPSGSGHRAQSSRLALLERHLDGAYGMPHSLRTLAAASEGRSSIMSEIRHVLDLMRRGEGLRFEDVMLLDHSILFGMADIHDRHRDMRLDVDNMSYEELLALEERIGNVCTGLTEETIVNRLKLKIYLDTKSEDQVETEPCSICREEYNDGEDLGTLECGHDFHKDCIKQWLMQKNLCPICKTTGLNT